MGGDNVQLGGACIVADQSALWRCAGLRQVDRLLLGLNALAGAETTGAKPMPVFVSARQSAWRSGLTTLPLPHLHLAADEQEFARAITATTRAVAVLPTRLVADRIFGTDNPTVRLGRAGLLVESERVHRAIATNSLADLMAETSGSENNEDYLVDEIDAASCEERLLRGTAKTQDGLISRLLNRPVSRSITRLLLPLPIRPNQITIALMILPLLGLWFLARGNYLGFAVGAVFFQLHSALDGCDGEVARLKYLQTSRGAKLDEVCDRISSLLYALGLGLGLDRQFGGTLGSAYLIESIVALAVIGIGETILTARPFAATIGNDSRASDYAGRFEHNFNRGDQLKLWVIRHSRMLAISEGFTSFFSHMTKRDVFQFGFLVIALCGKPSWILHIMAGAAAIILLLAIERLLSTRIRQSE